MNDEELKEAARDARRALDRKREEIRERLDVREQKVEVEKQHLEAGQKGEEKEMEEDGKKNVVNNFEAGSNCQVFNGNNSGCVFAMPGAMVTQQAAPPQPNNSGPQEECVVPEVLAESELWQKVKEAGLVDADGQHRRKIKLMEG